MAEITMAKQLLASEPCRLPACLLFIYFCLFYFLFFKDLFIYLFSVFCFFPSATTIVHKYENRSRERLNGFS